MLNRYYSGAQGFQGTGGIGTQGAQGDRGYQGYQGVQGSSSVGAQGAQGPTNTAAVTGPVSSLNLSVPIFNGTTGKILQDSGLAAGQIVSNLTGSAAGRFPAFTSTTGTVVNDSGYAAADFMIATPTTVNIGPTQTMAATNKLNIRGTVNSDTAGPHSSYYISTDQYPVVQELYVNHDNICFSWDAYKDAIGWKSSHSGANFQFFKNSNKFIMSFASGYTAGTALAWGNSFGITNTGTFENYKPITQTDPTDASSSLTGSFTSAGGMSCQKKLYVGTNASVGGTLAVTGTSNLGGKVTISATTGTIGIDLATIDSYVNARVIQNSTGPDKDIYMGFQSGAVSSLHLYSNNTRTAFINKGNVVMGGAITTTATDGYVYIPTVNGVITGAATAYAGCVPMVYDTSSNRLAILSGGIWRSALFT